MPFVSVAIQNEPVECGVQPWLARPYKLISWWEMEKFSAHIFFALGSYLKNTELAFIHTDQRTVEPGTHKQAFEDDELKQLFDAIHKLCLSVGLSISAKLVERIVEPYKEPTTAADVAAMFAHVEQTIRLEMEDRLFMFIPVDRAAYYNQQELFGNEVNARFPTIQFDMVEAGNCYATGRGTAVVFHLMRIMETGVQEFGNVLGVTFTNQKNWHNIVEEIDKKIKLLKKCPHTVELAEVSANLYAVKLAWRNEVMHPKDIYTLEEAENLIRQVKLFMQNLAKVI